MNEQLDHTFPSHLPAADRPNDASGGTAVASIVSAGVAPAVPSIGPLGMQLAPSVVPENEHAQQDERRAGGLDDRAPLATLDVDEEATAAVDTHTPLDKNGLTARDTVLAPEPVAAVEGANGKEPRRRRRQRATEENGEEGDVLAGLAPMVRHLAAATKALSEAQRTVGELTAERELLRRQLIDAGATPILPGENEGVRPGKEARLEARAAKQADPGATPIVPSEREGIRSAKQARLEAKAAQQAERFGSDEPTLSPEEYATRAEKAGRRRRMIALGVVAALVALIWIGRAMEVPVGDYLSKGGLAAAPIVGPLFQVMLAGFLIFRIVRVGGKAGEWLFPSGEPSKKKRRR